MVFGGTYSYTARGEIESESPLTALLEVLDEVGLALQVVPEVRGQHPPLPRVVRPGLAPDLLDHF